MRFSDVIGLAPVKEHLQNALRRDNISHAYLFEGEAGTGKKMLARTFAQSIQCTGKAQGEPEPCGTCRACIQVQNGTHPDVKEITSERLTVIGVEDVRKQVVEDAFLMPYAGTRKVYVIPEAHKLSFAAQNALLKTLEEPPEYVVILLLTENAAAFLPTVLSRVVMLPFQPVADDLIRRYLMEEQKVTDYAAALAVSFARGNVGRALQLVKSDVFPTRLKRVIALFSEIDALRIHQVNERLEGVLEVPEEALLPPGEGKETAEEKRRREKKLQRAALFETLEIISALLRDLLVYKATSDPKLLIFTGEMSYISKACEALSYEDLGRLFKELEALRQQLHANVNALIALQMFLLQIQERIQYS